MVKIVDFETPVSRDALELFQRVIDAKLPKPYLDFLLKYNGGYPEADGFDIEEQQETSSVQGFYKINATEKYDDLLNQLRVFSGRISKDLLPIAYDPFGNQICLAIRGLQYGQVFFWDHEKESDDTEGVDTKNTFMIGKSFDKFLESLSFS